MSKMKTARAFIALPLSESVRTSLADIVDDVAAAEPTHSVRWVKPELMHLTLRFLGDTDLELLEKVASGLDQIASETAAFDLRLHQAGCFPGRRKPRVLWVGVRDKDDQLARLKLSIDQMLSPLGWPVEQKRFHAHITIGRMRQPDRSVAEHLLRLTVPQREMIVPSIQLIESQLRRSGAKYTVRHSAALVRP